MVSLQITVSAEIKAPEGATMLVITIVSVDAGHAPFTIVQVSVFCPGLSPFTKVLAEVEDKKLPVPVNTDQLPVPLTGIVPESAAELPQTVKSWPA